MSCPRSARKVDGLLHDLLRGGLAPNLAAAAAQGGSEPEVFGEAATRFDLASVTKSMLAVAFARFAARETSGGGRDLLHAELGSLLDEARRTASEHVTMELLLAHRAGLAGHVALWLPAADTEVDTEADANVLRRAARARREDAVGAPPAEGFAPVYSDMGYLLAGEAAARAAGLATAGELIEREVVRPLGLDDELGTAATLAVRGKLEPVAPTEDVAFRGGIVRGVVHDENAFFFAGSGGAGHAGMFGTARAVAVFGQAVLASLLGEPSPLGPLPSWLIAPRAGRHLARRLRRQERERVERRLTLRREQLRSPRLHGDQLVDRSGRARGRRLAQQSRLPEPRQPAHPRGATPDERRASRARVRVRAVS